MTKENNESKIYGVKPAHDTDDFPVTQADKDLLKLTIHLMAWHAATTTWKKVLCDVNGKLIIDLTEIITIPSAAFTAYLDTYDHRIHWLYVKNRTALTNQYFVAPVFFPTGVTVTKVTLYGYRDDAASSMVLSLYRIDRVTGSVVMAVKAANWITGYSSIYDDTINQAVIDNVNYSYCLLLALDPNDSVDDVYFTGAKIEFTG